MKMNNETIWQDSEKSDCFNKIVQDVMMLRQESFSEDKDISFEMFQTCLGFHLAFYEREYKENEN